MSPYLVRLPATPRRMKQLVLVAADLLALPALLWCALALRYETLSPPMMSWFPFGMPLFAAACVSVLALCGVYRTVVRAFTEEFLHGLLLSVVLIAVPFFALAVARVIPVPRTSPLLFGFFAFLWVWASRSVIRAGLRLLSRGGVPATRVAIYGAGTAGRQTLAALRAAPAYLPVAFLDDAGEMVGTTVHGLRVYRGQQFEDVHRHLQIDEVLLALPSSSRGRRRAIVESLARFPVRVRALPSFAQLVGGEVSVSDIRQVDIVDLLGRDPVPPMSELLNRDIAGKNVLVTGAGGSIGSELCRQVLDRKPTSLLLFDVSEYALYTVDRELQAISGQTQLIPILGTVLDQERMTQLMREYRIDTVYHAAAYKHVPLVECNPFEGVVNNAIGTQRTALAAIASRVSTFVLISTDKAVRPTNVMGASKRLAEMVLQALALEPETATRFCMVRFGNVLGSSGSVVPLFREQIARGGPVTVTHPEVTRYFMTIPEAAQLVIQAGAMGTGGDVFVLDMGDPVKVVDLARRMIQLSGMSVREPGQTEGDMALTFCGLRPGEKLYEELLIGADVTTTNHPRILRARENLVPLSELSPVLESVVEMARRFDVRALKYTLAQVVEGCHFDGSGVRNVPTAPPNAPTAPLRAAPEVALR